MEGEEETSELFTTFFLLNRKLWPPIKYCIYCGGLDNPFSFFPLLFLLSAKEAFCYSQSSRAAMQLILRIVFMTENDAVEVGNTERGYDGAPVGFTGGV